MPGKESTLYSCDMQSNLLLSEIIFMLELLGMQRIDRLTDYHIICGHFLEYFDAIDGLGHFHVEMQFLDEIIVSLELVRKPVMVADEALKYEVVRMSWLR